MPLIKERKPRREKHRIKDIYTDGEHPTVIFNGARRRVKKSNRYLHYEYLTVTVEGTTRLIELEVDKGIDTTVHIYDVTKVTDIENPTDAIHKIGIAKKGSFRLEYKPLSVKLPFPWMRGMYRGKGIATRALHLCEKFELQVRGKPFNRNVDSQIKSTVLLLLGNGYKPEPESIRRLLRLKPQDNVPTGEELINRLKSNDIPEKLQCRVYFEKWIE